MDTHTKGNVNVLDNFVVCVCGCVNECVRICVRMYV